MPAATATLRATSRRWACGPVPGTRRACRKERTARSSSTGAAGKVLIFVASAAPSATPASARCGSGRPRRARHTSQADVSTNPAAGTSRVASDPFAMTSGDNVYRASATNPPTAPTSSRANARTTRPNSSVSTITGSLAQNITRQGSLPDSYSSRRPSAV